LRIYLIDMDYAVSYGQRRQIGTYQSNVLGYYDHLGSEVHENTDDLGFHYVKNYLLINMNSA
jgi:hypothetical protein